MGGIASSVEEIDNAFYKDLPVNRAIKVNRVVKLRDDWGFLIENMDGTLCGVGRASRANKKAFILGVEAQEDSMWGALLEGLRALGRISREDINNHRTRMAKYNEIRGRERDAKWIKEICERNGWAVPRYVNEVVKLEAGQ